MQQKNNNYRDDNGNNDPVPDWLWNQWKYSVELYKSYISYKSIRYSVKNPRIGGCTIVGLNNRGYKVTSVKCDEVADVICEPTV